MSHETYEIDVWKECPRCGENKARVSVYHFGASHRPMCLKCGLGPKGGDRRESAEALLVDSYFNYEHQINPPNPSE